MKAEELKGKTFDELKAVLMDLRKEQFGQRFQAVSGQMEKTHEVRKVRRDIARVKTFMAKANNEAAPAKKPAKKKAA
jgi:large subunit ribosomal protein L29